MKWSYWWENTPRGREWINKIESEKKAEAVKYAEELRMNTTREERRLYNVLKIYGIPFEFQKPFYIKGDRTFIKKFYIVDFYLPDIDTIIEVDGGFHLTEYQINRDNKRTEELKNEFIGIRIMRILNDDVMDNEKFREFLLPIFRLYGIDPYNKKDDKAVKSRKKNKRRRVRKKIIRHQED